MAVSRLGRLLVSIVGWSSFPERRSLRKSRRPLKAAVNSSERFRMFSVESRATDERLPTNFEKLSAKVITWKNRSKHSTRDVFCSPIEVSREPYLPDRKTSWIRFLFPMGSFFHSDWSRIEVGGIDEIKMTVSSLFYFDASSHNNNNDERIRVLSV